jgi:hypothetical protein
MQGTDVAQAGKRPLEPVNAKTVPVLSPRVTTATRPVTTEPRVSR